MYRTCKKDSNIYGYSAWSHHIESVVKFALILADKLEADKEILEIAALLHDIGSVTNKDWYEEHHIHGARIAQEILEKYSYPEEKIKSVKECIIAHRGSRDIKRLSLEAQILASADAMSHFENVDSLMHLAYAVHKLEVDEGREFVLGKLARSWKKLMPEAKDILYDKYEAIKKTFTN